MKNLILADIHSRSTTRIVKEEIKKGIERVISLGDFDEPEALEEFLSLEIPKISVVGNHEYPFIYSFRDGKVHRSAEFLQITEAEINRRKDKWHSSKILEKYAFECLAKFDNSKEFQLAEDINGRRIAYVHGLLYGSRVIRGIEFPAELWAILKKHRFNDELLKQNFTEMQQRGYNILFRGHEHASDMESIGTEESPFMGCIWYHNPNPHSKEFELSGNRRYIITAGAFTWGHYAIFDDKNFTVKFKFNFDYK